METEIQSSRDFKGVWIPKELWLNTELTMLEKAIFIEIDSLDGKDGCWASNAYLANFCQCSADKITTAVRKLKELGFIEVANFDGRHRIIRVVSNKKRKRNKDVKVVSIKFRKFSLQALAMGSQPAI